MTIYGINFGYQDNQNLQNIKVNVYNANGCASKCTVSSVDAPEGPQMHHIQCNYPQPGNASKSVSKSEIQISIFLTFSSEYFYRFYARR